MSRHHSRPAGASLPARSPKHQPTPGGGCTLRLASGLLFSLAVLLAGVQLVKAGHDLNSLQLLGVAGVGAAFWSALVACSVYDRARARGAA